MILGVALDTPLRSLFDYRPPSDGLETRIKPGQRLWVPFGRRKVVAVVTECRERSAVPTHKLRAALSVIDTEPVIDPVLLDLLVWSADYYHHPIGEVVFGALPPALRAGADLHATTTQWEITAADGLEALPPRAKKLRAVFATLASRSAAEEDLLVPGQQASLRELERRGLVRRREVVAVPRLDDSPVARDEPPPLNDAQARAVGAIEGRLGRFETLVLKGVTGSGKTEVYLQLIAAVLASGGQALVLVPEIALTPQLLARFRARFGSGIAVLHSNLAGGDRVNAWRAARSGEASVVIGTRSAVFAPLARPGIVIVDEEHDASFKQQEGFRYSGRDLAIARAQRHRIPIVLGSATPALESLARAQRSPQNLLSLPYRAGNAVAPRVQLVDLRRHAATHGLAMPVLQAMQEHLRAGGQILLFLNRRGYAPVLFCPACGWAATCLRCESRLTVHRRDGQLKCHHCAATHPLIDVCPSCNAPTKPVGQGTERIEGALEELFPGVPVARIDRDSTRRKGALEAELERVHTGAARILVGTQMVTKGHHFPDVSLVVVLNADQGLFSTDFRASERLAQTIIQVAGRAGRAARAGEVLIQTEFPQHPLLQHLITDGYEGFAQAALAEREIAKWPPYSRLALLRAEATQPQLAMQFLKAARAQAAELMAGPVQLLGPAPAPMEKRVGRYRAQLLVKAPAHGPLQRTLSAWLPLLAQLPDVRRVKWSIDVDPLELF
ncbi:MAG TPA: primosomal protein N' [Steroidobacteraceae bacterium]|nr:primosomal protein N' [Steroidobacteraceae bacterium]